MFEQVEFDDAPDIAQLPEHARHDPAWFLFVGLELPYGAVGHPGLSRLVARECRESGRFAMALKRFDGHFGVVLGVDGNELAAATVESDALVADINQRIGTTTVLLQRLVRNNRVGANAPGEVHSFPG